MVSAALTIQSTQALVDIISQAVAAAVAIAAGAVGAIAGSGSAHREAGEMPPQVRRVKTRSGGKDAGFVALRV